MMQPLKNPKLSRFLLAFCAVTCAACDDETTSSDDLDGEVTLADSSIFIPEERADASFWDASLDGPDAQVSPAANLGWIEVKLQEPRPAQYNFVNTPKVTATAFDKFGKELKDVPLKWRIQPNSIAELDNENRLHFLDEGQGFIYACYLDTCGHASFYVDDAVPILQVFTPERGAILGGDNSNTIRVTGSATDTGGQIDVHVNGKPVQVAADGTFAIDLEAQFGVNTITVTADDGVRQGESNLDGTTNPPQMDRREVLWAPSYQTPSTTQLGISNALSIRLDQNVLGDSMALAPSMTPGHHTLGNIRELLYALIELVDLKAILGNTSLASSSTFSLSLADIDLGQPEIALDIVNGGIELFLELPDIRLSTAGYLALDTSRISLNGDVGVAMAVFARLRMSLQNGEIKVELRDDDFGIALEDIDGSGMEDPTAAALLETLGSAVQAKILESVETMLLGVVGEMLPQLLESATQKLTSVLSSIPLNLEVGMGTAPINLTLSVMPRSLDFFRHDYAALEMNAMLTHATPVTAPHTDRGVVTGGNMTLNHVQGQGLGAAIRLEFINGLLHEIWRARLLQIAPEVPSNLAALISGVEIDARMPPVLAPAPRGSDRLLELQIGDLRLTTIDKTGTRDVYTLSVRLGVGINFTADEAGSHFELVMDDSPNIKAQVLQQGSARLLLSPSSLVTTVNSIVWPMVQNAINGGLGFDLGAINIDTSAFGDYLPRLQSLTIIPDLGDGLFIRDSRIRLEGGANLEINLSE